MSDTYNECMKMIDEVMDIYAQGYPVGGGDAPMWYVYAQNGETPRGIIESEHDSIADDLQKMREWLARQ